MHVKGKYHGNLGQGIVIRRDKGRYLFDMSTINVLDKDFEVFDGQSGDFKKLVDIITWYISNTTYHWAEYTNTIIFDVITQPINISNVVVFPVSKGNGIVHSL